MRDISTDSYRLASYLLACGIPVSGTRREGRKTHFIFKNSKDIREVVEEFQYGNPSLPVRDVFAAQSRIKSLIFDSPFSER